LARRAERIGDGAILDGVTGLSVNEGLPRQVAIPGHHGPADMYLSPEDAAGVTFTVAAVDAATLVGKPLADLHSHDVDEIYLVVTPGLRFEVETDRGSVEVRSPASVRIPAGTRHRFVVREAAVAPCPFLGILLHGSG
jgi:mannose-6-phosphate isomerase-like protein (cupin superfamily)